MSETILTAENLKFRYDPEQPSESGSAWWWIIILAVIAGTGTGIAVWRKKKDKE